MKLARLENGEPEIFASIQGEGRNTGLPSVFIRASLCNLSCRWCDTPYTWNWEDTPYSHHTKTKYRKEKEIATVDTKSVAQLAAAFGLRNFIFTGGEPMLQQAAWIKVIEYLVESENQPLEFEIETNGTLMPSDAFLSRLNQINVSPKLSNSGVAKKNRYQEAVLKELALCEKADFKFVVNPENGDEINEILEIVEQCDLPIECVFLMPQAHCKRELETHQEAVAALCLRHGFHYSDRLHLRLYGSGRGV